MRRFIQSHRYQLIVLAVIWVLFSVNIVKPWQLFFLNDDFMHIPDARLVLRSGFFRPVPNMFLWVDKQLYGNSPLGFFITTILLHGLAVFSVYFLADTIQSKLKLLQKFKELPFWVALFFLLYPFHAESIMWTIARGSIMTTAFTLFSLACFVKADDLKKIFWSSWVWLLLALFSYESMWNVIPLFILVAWYKTKERIIKKKMAMLQSGIMAATFAIYLAIRFLLLNSLVGDGYEDLEDNMKDLKLVSGNLIKLTARLFTPAINDPKIFTGLFLMGALAIIIIVYRQFKANRATGIFMVILWVSMITGVFTASPLGIDTHFHESDRYLYYASFFFCLFIAILCQSFTSPSIRQVVSISVCVSFLVGFYFLQRDYAYSSSFTRGTIELVNKLPTGKRLVFIDVPERYHGALIFRTSLPEAIDWLCPKNKPDTVLVYSHTRNIQKEGGFKTGFKTMQELKMEKGEAFVQSLQTFLHQSGGDSPLLLWYGGGGLWQIN